MTDRPIAPYTVFLAAALGLTACFDPPASPPPPPPVPTDPNGDAFAYADAGDLVPDSGIGRADETLYLPQMRFPMEAAPAYANSQVWGPGGMSGPAGGQCDEANYAYPWHDNFCETRSWSVAFCPASQGHQGQDIRPATCEKAKHWAVAAEEGEIYAIGTYHVSLLGDSGAIYRYMHLDMAHLEVGAGTRVFRGQRIGRVSNDFGDTQTTIHLHFDVQLAITHDGVTDYYFVPPYTSLTDAYVRLLGGTP